MDLSKDDQAKLEALTELQKAWYASVAFFAEDVCKTKLRPKQLEFAQAFKNNRQITFKGGVGFGKTHVLAVLVWWSLFTHDNVQVTIFGPNEGQIKSGIWKELQIIHGRMAKEDADHWNFKGTRIERIDRPADCFAEFRLANKDNIASTRGIHQVNNFVFVDEATGVEEEVFTGSLINILTDPNPKLCLISNPSSTTGYFYRTWNDEAINKDWAKVHGRMADNPTVTPELIEQMAGQYGGKLSREYRVLVEGEFPLDDVDGLIPRHLVEAAVDNADAIPAGNIPVIWGLDPAGSGGDRSVLVKRHDNVVLEIKEWRGLNPTQLANKINDEYVKAPTGQRPKAICIDAGGIGNGVWSALREMGRPVKDVVANRSPTRNPSKYTSLRDQLWWECREWYATENVRIPNHQGLIEDCCTPTYDDDGGKIKVESKKTLRKRMRASPDFADALCLTFFVRGERFTNNWTASIRPTDLRWAE